MSGPKTSRYTLTAEQRRLLAEQRENQLRKAFAENERSLKVSLQAAIDKGFASSFDDRKESRQLLAEYSDSQEEFVTLYADYMALCKLYDYTAQKYACSPAAIPILRSEIQRIKSEAAEEEEQAYISRCLDEVMEEMGYAVLGSREVTKRNGKHFRSELYTYGEGTAVNVTYSSDGKIAMEIGKVDAVDRFPDEQEAALLCSAMNQFCEDFKEMEMRLLAKGIIPENRISFLPPDAEFAQIINTAEYEMKGKAERLKDKKKRKSTVNLKSMKRE